MEPRRDPSRLAATCRMCGEPQPAGNWGSETAGRALPEVWEQASPAERYCGVCGTPECDDATLDRLQSSDTAAHAGRLYGSGLVSPTPEVVAFMAGWDVASKSAADQSLVPEGRDGGMLVVRVACHNALPVQMCDRAQALDELEAQSGQNEHAMAHPEAHVSDNLIIAAARRMHCQTSLDTELVSETPLDVGVHVLQSRAQNKLSSVMAPFNFC